MSGCDSQTIKIVIKYALNPMSFFRKRLIKKTINDWLKQFKHHKRNSRIKLVKSSNSKNAEILSTDLKLKLPVIFCLLRLNIVDSPERLIARTGLLRGFLTPNNGGNIH